MPVFELTPVDLDHPEWTASTHKDRCRVHAPDELLAREYVDAEFRVATSTRNTDGTIATSPWRKPERAECKIAEREPADYRDGLVLTRWGGLPPIQMRAGPTPRDVTKEEIEQSRWRPVNADRLSSQDSEGGGDQPGSGLGSRPYGSGPYGQGPYGGSPARNEADSTSGAGDEPEDHSRVTERGAAEAEGEAVGSSTAEAVSLAAHASMRAEARVTRPVTPEATKRVVRNRLVLTYQAGALLEHLNELIGPEGIPPEQRNVSLIESLGLSPDTNESDLIALLTELRDEIGKFRKALESKSVDPTTLERLRDIGIDHLKALGKNKVLLNLEALSLAMMIWTLLERAGLIDPQFARELARMIIERFPG